MPTIIASRELIFLSDEGPAPISIQISAPERGDFGWGCTYTIDWPHERTSSTGWGIDQVQALLLTFEKIDIEIYCSANHESGRLKWTDSGKGYGFQIPKNGRDLLIGDDARFFG